MYSDKNFFIEDRKRRKSEHPSAAAVIVSTIEDERRNNKRNGATRVLEYKKVKQDESDMPNDWVAEPIGFNCIINNPLLTELVFSYISLAEWRKNDINSTCRMFWQVYIAKFESKQAYKPLALLFWQLLWCTCTYSRHQINQIGPLGIRNELWDVTWQLETSFQNRKAFVQKFSADSPVRINITHLPMRLKLVCQSYLTCNRQRDDKHWWVCRNRANAINLFAEVLLPECLCITLHPDIAAHKIKSVISGHLPTLLFQVSFKQSRRNKFGIDVLLFQQLLQQVSPRVLLITPSIIQIFIVKETNTKTLCSVRLTDRFRITDTDDVGFADAIRLADNIGLIDIVGTVDLNFYPLAIIVEIQRFIDSLQPELDCD